MKIMSEKADLLAALKTDLSAAPYFGLFYLQIDLPNEMHDGPMHDSPIVVKQILLLFLSPLPVLSF